MGACFDTGPTQRRRGSKDAAGDEKSEWERRLDKPSVPLKAIGDPGPPRWEFAKSLFF